LHTIESHHHTALDEVCGWHNNADSRVTHIECGQEFGPIMEPIGVAVGIHVNCASTQEHVPNMERNNRVLKEHC